MTNVQTALGVGQMENLRSFLNVKRNNYNYYISKGITLHPFREDIEANYWFYSYLTDQRDGLIDYLAKHQIQARPIWTLIHTLPPYQYSQSFEIEKASYYWSRVVNLPCNTSLTKEEIDIVADAIKSFK